MSTDGNLPDLRFPQTGGQGNSIHLSANTLKQHGRNGERRRLRVITPLQASGLKAHDNSRRTGVAFFFLNVGGSLGRLASLQKVLP